VHDSAAVRHLVLVRVLQVVVVIDRVDDAEIEQQPILKLDILRSIYTIRQTEGVLRHATQKIGSILFLLCRTTSKSVLRHKIHNTSVGLCKQTINLLNR
jgi:hypothetical protein